jgi:error-prone DNA polymerase
MPDKQPSSRPVIGDLSGAKLSGAGGSRVRRRPGEPAYAELLAASNFSFLRGASHPEELAAAAAVLGLAGFSVADRNTLAGAVRGHLAAKQTGARYAVGCRLAFRDGSPDVAVWPTNRAAYGRLCRLLSAGNLRAEKGACYLDLGDLLDWGAGLEMAVLPGRRIDAALERTLGALAEAFPNAVRLGATCLYRGNDGRRLAGLTTLARRVGVTTLALGDVLYPRAGTPPAAGRAQLRARARDARQCRPAAGSQCRAPSQEPRRDGALVRRPSRRGDGKRWRFSSASSFPLKSSATNIRWNRRE